MTLDFISYAIYNTSRSYAIYNTSRRSVDLEVNLTFFNPLVITNGYLGEVSYVTLPRHNERGLCHVLKFYLLWIWLHRYGEHWSTCVYIACREAAIPRTFNEVVEVSNIRKGLSDLGIRAEFLNILDRRLQNKRTPDHVAKLWDEKFNGSIRQTIFEVISDIWQRTRSNQPIM